MPEPPASTSPEDSETRLLVDQARAGDRDALDRLLARHLPGLVAFIRLRADRVVLARESASDVAQSVCREILGGLADYQYRGSASFRNWLYTWALNKLSNRRRYYQQNKRDCRREVTDEAVLMSYSVFCTPSQCASAKEAMASVETAFVLLPEHYRTVILLTKLTGLSIAEAAQEMGRSVESVKSLLKRAILRLATLMESERPGAATGADE